MLAARGERHDRPGLPAIIRGDPDAEDRIGRLAGSSRHRYHRRVAGRPAVAVALIVLSGSASGPAPATAQDPPLAGRIDAVSRKLLGAPYRLGPLGEESPPDTDPRFRLDAFDCTTYVETVLALSLAGAEDAVDGDDARRWLDRIRYTGAVPTFESRRHLIDAQWTPELIAAGVLRDVTRSSGGRTTRSASLTLRQKSWERSSLASELGLPWSAVPHGRHVLPYLPWAALELDDVRGALPPVAVLNVVAAPDRDTPTLVTHQGLLVRGDGGTPVVRHATPRRGRVVEEPIGVFLERARAGKRGRTPLGVNVLAIVGGGDAPAEGAR
jgi:hypothetical protein